MPFQIKDFASIVASQINHARSVTQKITDFQPGSVARTIMEAPAVEIEELYLQMLLGLRDAIPVATFLSFGFDRLPAAKARGFVSVSAGAPLADPITIPVGTEFSAGDGRVYTSTAEVVWLVGQDSVRVPVLAAVAGLSGNVAAGVINASPLFGDGFTVSNSEILTGRDEETDLEREARFAEFVASLSRGTVTACIYAAKQARVLDADGNMAEYVTRVGIDEAPGRVRLYLYASGGAPSAAIIANGQLIIDGTRDDAAGTITPGFRSAGVRVDVLPMVERAINLSVQLQMVPGVPFTPDVQQALDDQFASAIRAVLPNQTLYLGTLVESLLRVPNVQSVVPLINENIVCGVNEALVPGDLTVVVL